MSSHSKSILTRGTIFPYQWSWEDVEVNSGVFQTIIRMYGLNEKNENVYVSVYDYCPYVYLELPQVINWTPSMVRTLTKKLAEMFYKFPPRSYELVMKKKLYYSNVNRGGEKKLFPYIRLTMSSRIALNYARSCLRRTLHIPGVGAIKLKMHETSALPTLKFMTEMDIPSCGWIEFKGMKIPENRRESSFGLEFQCSYKTFKRSKTKNNVCPTPLILSFDIEANSSNPNAMPDATKPNDKIFQISCILGVQGEEEEKYHNYLLSMGKPDEIENTTVLTFDSEKDLLKGFAKFVRDHNPNIMIGYNILGFDFEYMLSRADHTRCVTEFNKQGVLVGRQCEHKEMSWSSSAYSNQEFTFLDVEGRLIVDMLPIIKRDYKLESYKLDSIGKHFKLSKVKQDLGHLGIFECYRKFTGESLACVGKYCVYDSIVVMLLFEKLQTWVGLTQMAEVCCVPIFSLYTKGQQIKCYSQLYIEANKANIVVEQDVYTVDENMKYSGATVVAPKECKLFDNVLMFDFASLYPTIQIAMNICYTTLVNDSKVPDSACNVIEWEDHIGCEHDKEIRKTKVSKDKIICSKNRHRFLKKPEGLLPKLLRELLTTRKIVKKDLKNAKERGDKRGAVVFDKRQLAIKVSANSMYGAMGVKKGYLPLSEGAASVTAFGRQCLYKAIDYIETKANGNVVYGDTDSVFCIFPHLKTPQECWDFSLELEKRFVTDKLYPEPMRLEFEEKFYQKCLLLSKKRYIAEVGAMLKGEVVIEDDMLTKGVLLSRRDNCLMLRHLYRDIVVMIIKENRDKTFVLNHIFSVIENVMSFNVPFKQFIISKSIKDDDSYKSEPAHLTLAKKLRGRGIRVDPGSRVPYLLTTIGGLKAKQSVKIEDPEYFEKHRDVLKVDRLYYVSKLETPIDELLFVAFGVKDFMKSFIKLQIQKQKIHTIIKSARTYSLDAH